MSNQLIMVFSGKKQSGKSSSAKYLAAHIANTRNGRETFSLDKDGELLENGRKITLDRPGQEQAEFCAKYGVKLYSFADPLKLFCINTLNLDITHCYGTDEQKNAYTHIDWDSIAGSIKKKWAKKHRTGRRGSPSYPRGPMTGREVMEIFGTDICRAMDPNCWARIYRLIQSERYPVALVTDARFPNEITIGTEIGAKAVRLTRKVDDSQTDAEVALDDFPMGEYSLVIDNQNMTREEKEKLVLDAYNKWVV